MEKGNWEADEPTRAWKTMTNVTRIYSVDYVSFDDDESFAVGSHMTVGSTFLLWCPQLVDRICMLILTPK